MSGRNGCNTTVLVRYVWLYDMIHHKLNQQKFSPDVYRCCFCIAHWEYWVTFISFNILHQLYIQFIYACKKHSFLSSHFYQLCINSICSTVLFLKTSFRTYVAKMVQYVEGYKCHPVFSVSDTKATAIYIWRNLGDIYIFQHIGP